MTVLAGGMIGSVLGFLWFNCHPASIHGQYRGMPWAACWACWPPVARQELLLVVVAGVFVVEALSVIVQVGVAEWRRRRLLRCARCITISSSCGWPENKIVVRFWIASVLCPLVGLASLKLARTRRCGHRHGVLIGENMIAHSQLRIQVKFGDESEVAKAPTLMKTSSIHIVFSGGGTGRACSPVWLWRNSLRP